MNVRQSSKTDECRAVPCRARTAAEHSGEDDYLAGYKGLL